MDADRIITSKVIKTECRLLIYCYEELMMKSKQKIG